MSNRLISLAYKLNMRTPLRKSLLVLLADKASDDGTAIYASKKTMADELCCSKRALQDTLKKFVAEGLLIDVGKRPCANGYTVNYTLNVGELEKLPRVKCWAGKGSSSHTSASHAPVNGMHPTGASDAPKPSENPPRSGAKAPSQWRRSKFPAPTGVFEEQWRAFCMQRRAPLTDYSYSQLCDHLAEIAKSGHLPCDLIDLAIEHGWSSVYPPKEHHHGRPYPHLPKTTAALVSLGGGDDTLPM